MSKNLETRECQNDWYENMVAAIEKLPKFEGFKLDSVDARGCPFYTDGSGRLYSLSASEKLRPAINAKNGQFSPELEGQPQKLDNSPE